MATTTKTNQPVQRQPTPSTVRRRLHWADGNKGGVGKSFVARTLYQWHLDHQVPVIGVEADVNSPDFKGIYPEVMVARFSEDERKGAAATTILNTAVESQQHLVVNLAATVHEAFKDWVEVTDFLAVMDTYGIQPVKWFVVTGEYDSLMSLQVSLATFGQVIPHVVVRNQKFEGWEFFDSFADLQALIRSTRSVVIDLPRLNSRIASTLLQQRLSFEAARVYKGNWYGVGEQSQVGRYLRLAYAAMESTGYLLS